MPVERLQKILSARGICSRRKAEEYIEQGLVTVNGVVATLGQKADPESDKIEVDGKVLEDRKEMLYYVLHKPIGVVTTNANRDDQKTVRDLLPTELQDFISPVGRLDKDSHGLLLLTNDGVLAYRLTHPSFYHEKEYEVEVEHAMKTGQLKKLEEGITIGGEKTKPATVKKISDKKFRIALTEGKNRQIRRMCQKVGSPVVSLKRIRIVSLSDDKLKPGKLRQLTTEERDALIDATGINTA